QFDQAHGAGGQRRQFVRLFDEAGEINHDGKLSSLLHPVPGRLVNYLTLKCLIDIEGGLRAAQQKVTARTEQAACFGEDGLFGLDIEINQDVAQKNDVQRRQRRPVFDEVHLAELDAPAQIIA